MEDGTDFKEKILYGKSSGLAFTLTPHILVPILGGLQGVPLTPQTSHLTPHTLHLTPHIPSLPHLLPPKPYTQNIGLLPFLPVPISGRQNRPIGKQFQRGIGTIRPSGIVFESNSEFAFFPLHQILIASDPGDPVSVGRTGGTGLECQLFRITIGTVGLELAEAGRGRGIVAKGNQEPPIWKVEGLVAVSGKGIGQFSRGSPGLAFVVGENDMRVESAGIFPE